MACIRKQVYICVDLTARTQNTTLRIGKGKKGMLTMTEDGEKFEFDEQLPEMCERNPKIWTGRHLNIHKNKQGQYMVHFKRTELDSRLDPCNFADEIFEDIERAKTELGL